VGGGETDFYNRADQMGEALGLLEAIACERGLGGRISKKTRGGKGWNQWCLRVHSLKLLAGRYLS